MTDAPNLSAGHVAIPDRGAAAARPRRRFRRIIPAIAGVLIGGLLLLTVWALVAPHTEPGDPESTQPDGTAAVAQLLRDHGVTVQVARHRVLDLAQPRGATVVVSDSTRLNRNDVTYLMAQRPARIVFVGPGANKTADSGEPAGALTRPTPADPACSDEGARRAGRVVARSTVETTASTGCYPVSGGYAMSVNNVDGIPVYVIGGLADNATLSQEGNASLALDVLGSTQRVEWLIRPDTRQGVTHSQRRGFLPAWAGYGIASAGVAAIVIGVWRGRRFGPVLSERLPVVVRASETVEGHGRLYERIEARDAATVALRRATLARLRRRLGTDDPERLADLLAGRETLTRSRIYAVLAGPIPTDDHDLIQLKHDLDTIEQEARTP